MLSQVDILSEIDSGGIVIHPFNERQLNPNSYDLTMGTHLAYYPKNHVVDPKHSGFDGLQVVDLRDFPDGYETNPDIATFYLVCTVETVTMNTCTAVVYGKSSICRMGISVGLGGGFGDVGYSGSWTISLIPCNPVRLYYGMPFCQIAFTYLHTSPEASYATLPESKYQNSGTHFDLESVNYPTPHAYHKSWFFRHGR